ncbi:MAG: hypothetical protein ACJ0QO_01275 [Parvicellaceae bacterium]
MKIEVFYVKGEPIWFFTPYSFIIDLEIFTELEHDRFYKSSDLILSDKLAIEKELILQFKDINKEILSKDNQLVLKVNSFEIMLVDDEN